MQSFLTGSQVYGTPTTKSDVDLAILLTEPEFDLLRMKLSSSEEFDGSYPDGTACFRIGKLNLLAFIRPAEFTAWKIATDYLVTQKPVTRSEAIRVIEQEVETAKAKARLESHGALQMPSRVIW